MECGKVLNVLFEFIELEGMDKSRLLFWTLGKFVGMGLIDILGLTGLKADFIWSLFSFPIVGCRYEFRIADDCVRVPIRFV